MEIFLKSGGKLRTFLEPDVDEYTRRVEIEEGLTLEEILARLSVPKGTVAFAISQNEGKVLRLSYVPKDGDILTLQPPVSGG